MIHKHNAVQLQVPKNMIILINSELYYADAKASLLGGKNDDSYYFQNDVSPAQYATYQHENNTNKRDRNYAG